MKQQPQEVRVGEKIYRPVAISNVKAVEGNPNRHRFTISSIREDRDADIIEPRGIDLRHFKKNPVVLWAHDYYGLPIGRSPVIETFDDHVEAEVEYAPTEFAQEVKTLVELGFLKTASIGFIPREMEKRTDEEGNPIGGYFGGYHFKKSELLEWSIVPVPVNPFALVHEAKAAGHKVEALELALAAVVRPDEHAPAPEAPAEERAGDPGEAITVQLNADGIAQAVGKAVDATLADVETRITEKDALIADLTARVQKAEGELADLLIDGKDVGKAGAVLNRKNKDLLTQARDAAESARALIQQVLDSAEPEDETETEDDEKRQAQPVLRLVEEVPTKAEEPLAPVITLTNGDEVKVADVIERALTKAIRQASGRLD